MGMRLGVWLGSLVVPAFVLLALGARSDGFVRIVCLVSATLLVAFSIAAVLRGRVH